jgi:prepilin-type N-terminal cleavage/methylation domain-containing protein
MRKKKGFTLIELLVVISIIGILASVVLVSLGEARSRAKDGRVIADMNQLRSVGEVYAGNNGDSYTGLDANVDENTIESDVYAHAGAGAYTMRINAGGTGYCATAKLNSGHYWCVDSLLHSKDYGTSAPATCAAACVAANTCKCE